MFWRALNLQAAPFDFPPPDRVIVEPCSELDGACSDKSLGLWNIAALACLMAPGRGALWRSGYGA